MRNDAQCLKTRYCWLMKWIVDLEDANLWIISKVGLEYPLHIRRVRSEGVVDVHHGHRVCQHRLEVMQ